MTVAPRVLFAPESSESLKRGFDTFAQLLATTLGPSQGVVLTDSQTTSQAPEVIGDAATIARRVVALPDRREDVGAMLLRNVVWRTHQRVGDGTATTAVLARAILDEATRMVAAGGSAVSIQQGIQKAAKVVEQALHAMAQPAASWEQLAAVGFAVAGRRDLGDILGELGEMMGAQAHIEIKDYLAPTIEREYLPGGRWVGELISPYLINAPGAQKAIVSDTIIVLYAGKIMTGAQVMPLMRLASQRKPFHILLVAYEFSEEATKTLVGLHTHPKSNGNVVGFKLLKGGESGQADMEDLACLTGGTVLGPDTGRLLENVAAKDFGYARRIEADRELLSIIHGQGDPTEIRERSRKMEAFEETLDFDDEQRKRVRERIGRLSGNVAILKLGALAKAEREFLHSKAEQGVKAIQSAVRAGVVPGGGTAYMRCIPAVDALLAETEGDARFGVRALRNALAAPLHQIVRNATHAVPEVVFNELERRGPETVYDVMTGEYVPALAAGLLDATEVLQIALQSAVSGAVMALSIDSVVLNKNPEMSFDP